MVNERLVMQKLSDLRISVARLEKFQLVSLEEFEANPDNFAIAEHHLRRSLEMVLDIGRHIVAKEKLGRPDYYREVLEILKNAKILEQSFAKRISGMAGYRNRLVHGYSEISSSELLLIITEQLDDFLEFEKQILDYLKR